MYCSFTLSSVEIYISVCEQETVIIVNIMKYNWYRKLYSHFYFFLCFDYVRHHDFLLFSVTKHVNAQKQCIKKNLTMHVNYVWHINYVQHATPKFGWRLSVRPM